MSEFLEAAKGSGSYFIVFVGMGLVIGWLNSERKRVLQALESSNERLLEERDRRAEEGKESAKLMHGAMDRIETNSKLMERLMERWNSLPN